MEWVKINFDGSVQGLQGSTGFVIRDCDGHVLLAGDKKIGEVTITVAEGLALCDLLILAIDSGWKKLVIEGDAKLIMDCVKKKVAIKWSVHLVVQDIWQLSSSCESVSFEHVFREANFTVDALAG